MSEHVIEEFETDFGERYAFLEITDETGATVWTIEREYLDGTLRRCSPMIMPGPYESAFATIMQREMGA